MSWRGSVTQALEALEAGDVAEATAILRAALEAAPARGQRVYCPECGLRGWPGLIAAHVKHVHGVFDDEPGEAAA
jgi:hypothetical protein